MKRFKLFPFLLLIHVILYSFYIIYSRELVFLNKNKIQIAWIGKIYGGEKVILRVNDEVCSSKIYPENDPLLYVKEECYFSFKKEWNLVSIHSLKNEKKYIDTAFVVKKKEKKKMNSFIIFISYPYPKNEKTIDIFRKYKKLAPIDSSKRFITFEPDTFMICF